MSFFRLQILGLVQISNFNERIAKKCKKPPFLGQNGQFWTLFGQKGQDRNFFKKALVTFFSHLQTLTNCKVSEKIMNGFRETALRMNEGTHVIP